MRPRDRKEKPPVVIANRISFNKRKQEQERDADRKLGDTGQGLWMDPSVCSPLVSLVTESSLWWHIIQGGPGLRGVLGLPVLQRERPRLRHNGGGRPVHVLTAG